VEILRELREQLLVEMLLARERALACAEHLVPERLQLRRDVALRALQRLPAHGIGRHALRMRLAELDVEAVHTVVADLEARDAGALALLRLELGEMAARVLAERAQLV